MGSLVRLCVTDSVGIDEPVAVEVEGLPSMAVFRVDDDYFVTANECTHGKAMLTDGFQEGARIECPFHGGAFDVRSGHPVAFPCQVALKTYPAILDDGWVCIHS